ncbi:RNA/RNP complex-1-interacting phosphatase isoform X2 [Chrysoperla carnea]|uniref:RNA/RNP complex-1-interacting phosphatase isoform X2 n=1 Tax=Chrysoperla carnea TaxID=189513 RepID=UPI001D0862C3|nr:RNA/RNP complex-1-interacting phosphatase isoform X2 [Chrysoperla carnea]
MGNNTIPDRWEPYSCVGKQIPGTRFLAFKVPLKTQISAKVDFGKRFTPKHLIEQVPNLGLVIDLTNTKRYYDQRDITVHGVEYVKVACVGRLLPSDAVLNKFIKVVDEFLKENADNDKLIGVHCTHGVNRTGYFICKYMIDKMNYNPLIAIKAFDEARGHKMERDIYINELVNGSNLGASRRSTALSGEPTSTTSWRSGTSNTKEVASTTSLRSSNTTPNNTRDATFTTSWRSGSSNVREAASATSWRSSASNTKEVAYNTSWRSSNSRNATSTTSWRSRSGNIREAASNTSWRSDTSNTKEVASVTSWRSASSNTRDETSSSHNTREVDRAT